MQYGVTTRQQESLVYTGQLAARVATLSTGAAAVNSLFAAAGASTAGGPVGWVVAGGLALAGATLQLISLIKQRNLREAQAIQVAQQLGLPGAAAVPGWIFEALAMGPNQRHIEGLKLEKKLGKGGSLFNPEWDIRTKLTILGLLDLMDMAARRAELGLPAVPPSPQVIQAVFDRADRMKFNAQIAEYTRYGLVIGGLRLVAYALFSE